MKIFRNIRKKLAAQNRVAAYLRYAVGEIVLVVIGILIALQVNTFNKDLQNKALAKTSLANLREDLEIQKKIIHEQIDYEDQMLDKTDSCFRYLNAALPLNVLYKLLTELAARHTFVANDATFNNMVSTGTMVLIKNPELQNAIVNYYQQLDYTTKVVHNNNLFLIDNQFGSFVVNNSLGFRLKPDGKMDMNYTMTPEQRFTLQIQLSNRQNVSKNMVRICNLQLEATEKLIQRIDHVIKD
jgi:hypothetical protein